jgi:ketosteroid isomerase-like protein
MLQLGALILLASAAIASGERLQQPVEEARSGSSSRFDAERAAILALRAANNRAMAAGDLEGTMRIVARDYVLVSGSGQIVRSAEEMRAIWAGALRDKSRLCVRTPLRVDVGANRGVLRAAESGEWTCRGSAADATDHGAYFAHWSRNSGAWQVTSDTYVALGCRGAGCATR